MLLREIAARVATLGWSVGNCDVTLAARRPKIAPRADEMRARLAEAMGISPAQVNVKGTTGKGWDSWDVARGSRRTPSRCW